MPNQNIIYITGATPTPTPTNGSLILNFDELVNDLSFDGVVLYVNDSVRTIRWTDTQGLYTTNLNLGDVVRVQVSTSPSNLGKQISIIRRDYTTDDQNGDDGIRDTFITSTSGTTSNLTVIFTATTVSDSYNFEYIVTATTFVPPPTPTPTATPTPTPTGTPTPTPTPTPTGTPTPTPTVTPVDLKACGTLVSTYQAYPATFYYDLSIYTGTTVVDYNNDYYPDRFLLYQNGVLKIDSGYRGSSLLNYGGIYRYTFTAALQFRVDPLTSLTYPNAGVTDAAPDGYPYVVAGTPGSISYNKTGTTSDGILYIYAPNTGTYSEVTVNCPSGYPTPTPTATPTPTPTPIIPSNLVLNLDAGNPSSYPTTGTTWNDLSGGGHTTTLVNGPTYSSSNGGSIVFDGVNDYANVLRTGLTFGSNFTWNMWFKTDKTTDNQRIFANWNFVDVVGFVFVWQINGGQLDGNIRNTDGVNILPSFSATTISASTIYNLAITWEASTKTAKIYLNGSLNQTLVSSLSNVNIAVPTGTNMTLAQSDGGDYLDGNIYNIQAYSKTLTATEVSNLYSYYVTRYS